MRHVNKVWAYTSHQGSNQNPDGTGACYMFAPPEFENLSQLDTMITEGDHCGMYHIMAAKKISAKQAAKELIKQNSDPEFFRLDEKGNDIR